MDFNPVLYYNDDSSGSVNIKNIILDLSQLNITSITDVNKAIEKNNNIIYNTLVLSENAISGDLDVSSITNILYCQHLIVDNANTTNINLDLLPRNLKKLSFKNNNIDTFSNIIASKKCKTLLEIDLSGNYITKEANYRVRLLDAIPSLVYIDGTKITKNERKQSRDLRDQKTGTLSADKGFEFGALETKKEIIESLKQKLLNAETLEEIDRLELELSKYS